ncbi:MAG: N-acetylmuramoyl-L-alanine amidase [Cytophagaceae bacterium]|nr:N-acetylmuramoyl-L-alanine amidase [Cytophagaceae bacterium]
MRNKKYLTLISCVALLFSTSNVLNVQKYKVKTIVIDAGHGGKDPGCIGYGSREKDIALDIALKLGEFIKENMKGVKVIYTRDKDVFVDLHQRASIANKSAADLFISIHVNSGPTGLYGTETYCMGLHKTEQNLSVAQRENSSILLEADHKKNYDGFDPQSPQSYILFSLYQNAYINNSMMLAAKIEQEFERENKRKSRGVKQAGFLVLWKTAMPSVLVETGFLSDSSDAAYLKTENGRIDTAWSIYTAIEEYKEQMEAEE